MRSVMFRQLLTILAVLSGLAAFPAAAELRTAEPRAQLANSVDLVVTAERAAVVALRLRMVPKRHVRTGMVFRVQDAAILPTVYVGIDRARE